MDMEKYSGIGRRVDLFFCFPQIAQKPPQAPVRGTRNGINKTLVRVPRTMARRRGDAESQPLNDLNP